MLVAAATEKMVRFYQGNVHDVSHFLKVYTFAKTIGKLEGLAPQTQETLELAALYRSSCLSGYRTANLMDRGTPPHLWSVG